MVHRCDKSTRLDTIQQEHDIAKAVKSDDAAVPIYLWDERLGSLLGMDTGIVAPAARVLRSFLLKIYRRSLTRDCIAFLRKAHGGEWWSKRGKGQDWAQNIRAIRDIVARAGGNDWFEYPMGSKLLFFRFPKKYQGLARDGIPIKFVKPGPTKMDAQPSLVPAAQKVLKDKIGKMLT